MVPCTSSFGSGSNEASISAFPAHMSSASERAAAGSQTVILSDLDTPAVGADLGCHVSSGGVVRPERKSRAPSGADTLATAPPTKPGAPQATVTLPSSCISGLLRAVRGVAGSRFRGAQSRPRLS
jgi:hypothetical protein